MHNDAFSRDLSGYQKSLSNCPFEIGLNWTGYAYEFPDQTGLDTQISWTGPAGPDGIRTYIFNILPNKYRLTILI